MFEKYGVARLHGGVQNSGMILTLLQTWWGPSRLSVSGIFQHAGPDNVETQVMTTEGAAAAYVYAEMSVKDQGENSGGERVSEPVAEAPKVHTSMTRFGACSFRLKRSQVRAILSISFIHPISDHKGFQFYVAFLNPR